MSTILDEISPAIVNELRVTLGAVNAATSSTLDLYHQFLQAACVPWQARSREHGQSRRAVPAGRSRAPDYAPAWAGLASALAQLSRPSTGEEIIPPDPRLRTGSA